MSFVLGIIQQEQNNFLVRFIFMRVATQGEKILPEENELKVNWCDEDFR